VRRIRGGSDADFGDQFQPAWPDHAQIAQNVFDTATGKYLLLPQGSRLVGSSDR
jgi:hypothetical protein